MMIERETDQSGGERKSPRALTPEVVEARIVLRVAELSALIERGVKPRLMIWRVLVCCGGSWLISMICCSSTWSRCMSGPKRMIAPFSAEEKSLLTTESLPA